MYELTGTFILNCEIVGYAVKDENGETLNFSREHVIKLSKQGLFSNVKVSPYNGKDYIVGVGVRLSQLPFFDAKTNKLIDEQGGESGSTMKVIGRIVADGETTGYVVQDKDGKQYKLSKKKAWELSMHHLISNTKIQLSNGVKVITGDGFSLSSLPVMQ